MATDPLTIRAEADEALFERLVARREVQRAIESVEEEAEKRGTRRSLLATALRLTPTIAPELWEVVDHCRTTLNVETEVELFVYPSASFNAACTAPEGGRVFILMSSSLAEAFTPDELRWVLGHELGHHIYGHHKIPLRPLLEGEDEARGALPLLLFTWQRFAEISADRAGLLCGKTLETAACSLFKLSSGFKQAPDQQRIEAFMQQAEELYKEDEVSDAIGRGDWASSHPFSPIRLRAAEIFMRSEVFVDGGLKLPAVEEELQELMELMQPSYLEEKSEEAEAMRLLLFAAGVVVAGLDGVTKDEMEALEELLPGRVPVEVKPELLKEHLQERIDRVMKLARPARRAQVVRDLVLIARADGEVTDEELEVMTDLARSLDLNPCLVFDALSLPCELD